MKKCSSMMMAVVSGLMLLGMLPLVCGTSDDLQVSRAFSKNPANQGDLPTVSIKITNKANYQAKITWTGIHFDWMATDIYVVDNNTYPLATGQSVTIVITFEVPSNVLTGHHTYDIVIKYDLQDGWFDTWNSYTWQSQAYTDFRVEERDRDGDGVPDSEDAFPDDPSETKDSDKDGVGDNKDAFPYDPNKWKKDTTTDTTTDETTKGTAGAFPTLLVGGVIAVIIMVAIIVVAVIILRRKPSVPPYPPTELPPRPPAYPPQQPPIMPEPYVQPPIAPLPSQQPSISPPIQEPPTKKFCSHCGQPLSPIGKSCQYCGAEK